MLVLICSPRPDPLTGRAFPSVSPLAGQPGLGLCWMTVLLVFEWVCVCVFVCQPTLFGTSWVLEICWHCSLLADLQLSGFPGGPLLIRLSRKLYRTGQTSALARPWLCTQSQKEICDLWTRSVSVLWFTKATDNQHMNHRNVFYLALIWWKQADKNHIHNYE